MSFVGLRIHSDYNMLDGATASAVADAEKVLWEGKYIACVKVADTFGCNTHIAVEVSP
jgi:DNA polymerase III alpha subunit